jgi:hypothetical protein
MILEAEIAKILVLEKFEHARLILDDDIKE